MYNEVTVIEGEPLDLDTLDVQELELRVEFKPWVDEATIGYDYDDHTWKLGVGWNF